MKKSIFILIILSTLTFAGSKYDDILRFGKTDKLMMKQCKYIVKGIGQNDTVMEYYLLGFIDGAVIESIYKLRYRSTVSHYKLLEEVCTNALNNTERKPFKFKLDGAVIDTIDKYK